jgi:hypothetical protein
MSKLRKAIRDRANRRRRRFASLCRDKIEQIGLEDILHCAEICANPATIPTGTRVMVDQSKLLFVDGNMHEYTREDYIKNNGIDPLPIWKAIEKWREEQMEKWKK